jgi:DNA-binding Lrp family transcriptional regulator
MDDTDRLLLDALQDGVPVCARPFAALARQTGISEQDIVARVARMLDAGMLSRFGPLFNVETFGGSYVLAAMAVPADAFERVVALLNGYDEVAHNYERDHRLNVWFVVAAPSPSAAERVLADIEARSGIPVRRLPKEREYFVGARFAA